MGPGADRGFLPLRLLHVLAPAESGGLESVVRGLALGLGLRGHTITVAAVVTPAPSHRFVEEARAAGIDVRAIQAPPRAYASERRAVRKLIAEVRAEVLHTHGYRPDVIHRGVAGSARIPAVSTVHGFIRGGWKGRLYERVQVRALRRFDAVVAVSDALRQELLQRGVPPARLHLIANAWGGNPPVPRDEARRRLGLPAEALVIGWIGRLSAEKGPDLAVRALAAVAEPASLSFVGDGPERTAVSRLADELVVSGRIRWHGIVPGAGELLRAFDAVLLSSRTEGTPMVILEAMAAEVPIVAADVGGVSAAMLPGAGELVEAGSPAALARALEKVLAGCNGEPGGIRGSSSALEVGRVRWLEQYESLYRGLVGAKQ